MRTIARLVFTLIILIDTLRFVYRNTGRNDSEWISAIAGLIMFVTYIALLYLGGFYS